MAKGFIFNFVPTGMVPMKEMTPAVPVTPEEIIDQVLNAAERGINMVHLHARETPSGIPTHKKAIYSEIIEGIRRKNRKLIIGVSTSGRCNGDFEKRSEVLDLDKELKPDFASLTLSSLNFEKQASVNSPEVIQQLARKMVTKGIRPELEVFDLGMINYAKYLIRKGILSAPYYFNIILGNIAGAQADLGNLSFMVRELPEQSIWSIGGFGSTQLPMNVAALVAGGGVRVGLEDNIWYDEKKTVLATNIDLIERLLVIARVLEQTPFPVEEARNLLKV